MCYLNQVEVRFPLFVFESKLAATSRKRPLRGSPNHALLGPWFVNPPLPTTEKRTSKRRPYMGWRFASRFSSTKAGWQQLRESCRLRRTAEPRAKATWFGNPPLLSAKSRHHKFGAGFLWWEGVDSNHRRHGRQIYSLLPLAAREPSLVGAGDRNRTSNLLITNQLLCQLSYTSPIAIFRFGASGRNRTTDTGIFSPLLYRLSYRGIFFMSDIATTHKIFWRFGRDSNPRPLA